MQGEQEISTVTPATSSSSGTAAQWLSVITCQDKEKDDKAMENLVCDYFRNVIFHDVKFLNDFVVQHTIFDGPGYEGTMLHKVLNYVGKNNMSLPEKVRFWKKYATTAVKSLDRQKSNKNTMVRGEVVKGKFFKMRLLTFFYIISHCIFFT